MPPSLTVPEAREILTEQRLTFGNDEQIAAAQKLEASGDRSNAQHEAWKKRRDRFRKRMRQALEQQIFPCPCCGRLPWFLSEGSSCAPKIMALYDMTGRQCPPSWFVQSAKQWRSQYVTHKIKLVLVKE